MADGQPASRQRQGAVLARRAGATSGAGQFFMRGAAGGYNGRGMRCGFGSTRQGVNGYFCPRRCGAVDGLERHPHSCLLSCWISIFLFGDLGVLSRSFAGRRRADVFIHAPISEPRRQRSLRSTPKTGRAGRVGIGLVRHQPEAARPRHRTCATAAIPPAFAWPQEAPAPAARYRSVRLRYSPIYKTKNTAASKGCTLP